MKPKRGLIAGAVLCASVCLYGQNQAVIAAATEKSGKTPSTHTAYYIDPLPLHLALFKETLPPRVKRLAANLAFHWQSLSNKRREPPTT